MSQGSPVEDGPDLKARAQNVLTDIDTRLGEIAWYPLVKKEIADTVRTRAILVLSALFFVMFVLPVLLAQYTDLGQAVETVTALLQLLTTRMLSVLVPIAAIALTYGAISGERQRGSIKLLMALPYTRRDVLIGKLVGRFLALAAPVLAVIILQVVLILPEVGTDLDLRFVGVLLGMTLLLALSFVSLALGASAGTTTTQRSLLVAGGVWVYFFALWNSVSQGVRTILIDHLAMEQAQAVKFQLFVKLLNPTQAYQSLLRSLGSADATVAAARASLYGGLLGGRAGLLKQQNAQQILADGVPWYLTDAAAFGVLILWIIVPLYMGYQLFEGADL
jgi:ABC-2 type transport system permease protein